MITRVLGENLLLKFLNFDESIEKKRYSREIAPHESKTKQDYEWRSRCLTDSGKLPIKVDVLGDQRGWSSAEIVRIDDA